MKIRVKPEKYINCPPPSLTKGMMDYFYQTLGRIIIKTCNFKKINTINIRLNRAYEGCHSVHFYISINGGDEFHIEYSTGDENVSTYFMHKEKVDKSNYFRYDWIKNLDSNGVDVGTKKPTIRYEKRWDEIKKLEKIESEKKAKEYRYEQFIKLTEEFKPALKLMTIDELMEFLDGKIKFRIVYTMESIEKEFEIVTSHLKGTITLMEWGMEYSRKDLKLNEK